MSQLAALFTVELADRVQTLRTLLLQLERGDGDHRAFRRELHSLKGAARAVGARALEQVAHAAESFAQREPSGDEWFDALSGALEAFPGLRANPDADISEILRGLEGPKELAPAKIAAPVASSAAEQSMPQPPANNSVRVAISKLDNLLTESGELSVTHLRINERLGELRDLQRRLERWQRNWIRSRAVRARVRRADGQVDARDLQTLLRSAEHADQELHAALASTNELVAALSQSTTQLGAIAAAIGQEVMAVRLLPAGTVFLPLERLVRDLARQTGKEARLVLSGLDTEIDRRILDELRDPLMHMIRNSLDHGLEPADERVAAGKPGVGTLRLSADQRGDRVQITLEDDGRGLDIDGIRATAVRRGVLPADRAAALDSKAVIDLIFQPGFSTRSTVSELSGRGVGLDVVREHVARLGGDISVRTAAGSGTSFVITVPLTLATTRVLLVEDDGQTFAIPSSSIERTGRVRATDLVRLEGRPALQLDGRSVPVVELAEVLGQATSPQASGDEWRPFFVLAQADRSIALLTDRLVDEQELVIKALGAPLVRVRHVGGAAVLGTGAVVVILNPSDLVKSAFGALDAAPLNRLRQIVAVEQEQPRRRVLVVDDSVMTRTLERSILESAGYQVVVATDGQHALDLLNSTASDVDAIVSDVEMPRVTGIQLTTAVRQDERLRHLPVVLVTSLDAPEHVESGAAAGADAYIVKGRFDQGQLLQTLARLL